MAGESGQSREEKGICTSPVCLPASFSMATASSASSFDMVVVLALAIRSGGKPWYDVTLRDIRLDRGYCEEVARKT